MKNTVILIIIFALLNLNFALAQTSNEEEDRISFILNECIDNNPTTQGSVACIDVATKKWDKLLNKYYNLLKAELSDDGKEALLEAQREWIKMRDKEFLFIEQLYNIETGGGTMFIPMQLLERMDIIKNRTLELKSYYETIKTFSEE